MSWLFSRALVAEYSAGSCSDGELSAQLSGTPGRLVFLHSDKTTEFSKLSRYGMTCKPLTGSLGEKLLTWFLEASPARTFPLQGKATESKGFDLGCGATWPASWVKYDRASRGWKTAQCSLLGDSDEFLGTWPRWGFMRDGECLEVTTWEPAIVENESGFLPTPRASVGTHGICWKRAKSGDHRSQLEDFLGWLSLNNGGEVVSGRTVNPDFQDWLMVWPVQWSDLQPLAMDKYQLWLQQHGKCLEGQ